MTSLPVMLMRNLKGVFALVALAVMPLTAMADDTETPGPLPVERMPVINCSVAASYGSFFGYMPPEVGLETTLDMRKMVENGKTGFTFTSEPPEDSGRKRGDVVVGHYGIIPVPDHGFETLKNVKYFDERAGRDRLALYEGNYFSKDENSGERGWEVFVQVTATTSTGYRTTVIQKAHGRIDSFAQLFCHDAEETGTRSDDGQD